MAKLLFSRKALLGSTFIRNVTWSAWSHVELYINDGDVIGANALHGVVKESAQSRIDASSHAATMTIPANDDLAVAYAVMQLGKGYDYLGAIGLAFHQNWRDENKWWCSGLVTYALKAGGVNLFRDESINRITPQDIWQLPYDIKIIK